MASDTAERRPASADQKADDYDALATGEAELDSSGPPDTGSDNTAPTKTRVKPAKKAARKRKPSTKSAAKKVIGAPTALSSKEATAPETDDEEAAVSAPAPAPTIPPPPAQSEPPRPETMETGLKDAGPWVDAPPLSPYRAFMLRLHRLILDREGNRLDRTPTATETPLRTLRVVGRNRAHGHDYRPTPRRLVKWALECVPGSLDQTTFMDIGSGRGRVVLEAARWPFQRVVGIESAEELHEDAELNLRHWPRALMRCREVDLILGDAVETPLPETDLVVWMFDPFSERLATRIAARLAEHTRKYRVTLILVGSRNPMAFRESPTFREFEPLPAIRRRLVLFSPYTVRFFTATPR